MLYTAQVPAQVPRKLNILSTDSHGGSTSAEVAAQIPSKKQISQIEMSESPGEKYCRCRSGAGPISTKSETEQPEGQPGMRYVSGTVHPGTDTPKTLPREKVSCTWPHIYIYVYIYIHTHIHTCAHLQLFTPSSNAQSIIFRNDEKYQQTYNLVS